MLLVLQSTTCYVCTWRFLMNYRSLPQNLNQVVHRWRYRIMAMSQIVIRHISENVLRLNAPWAGCLLRYYEAGNRIYRGCCIGGKLRANIMVESAAMISLEPLFTCIYRTSVLGRLGNSLIYLSARSVLSKVRKIVSDVRKLRPFSNGQLLLVNMQILFEFI